MVAPKARDILNRGRPLGVAFGCPECNGWYVLRLETARDYPAGECPALAGQPGPLGFILRCDGCGFRVEMKGNRLATVAMIRQGG